MFVGTWQYSLKLLTNEIFYFGGLLIGSLYYLTGLSVGELQQIMWIVFLDIFTRCWAEWVNKRQIYSRKMFVGFSGKFLSYMVLFIFAQNSFILQEEIQMAILGGFTLVEGRSIFENLKDAKQKHIVALASKFEEIYNKFFSKKDDEQPLE